MTPAGDLESTSHKETVGQCCLQWERRLPHGNIWCRRGHRGLTVHTCSRRLGRRLHMYILSTESLGRPEV